MTFYEYIREELLGKNPDGTIPVWKAVVGGCVAGMTAQFLASPADLVKVQVGKMLERETVSCLTSRGCRSRWKGVAVCRASSRGFAMHATLLPRFISKAGCAACGKAGRPMFKGPRLLI